MSTPSGFLLWIQNAEYPRCANILGWYATKEELYVAAGKKLHEVILRDRRYRAKNGNGGKTYAEEDLQIAEMQEALTDPANWVLYAEDDLYCWPFEAYRIKNYPGDTCPIKSFGFALAFASVEAIARES